MQHRHLERFSRGEMVRAWIAALAVAPLLGGPFPSAFSTCYMPHASLSESRKVYFRSSPSRAHGAPKRMKTVGTGGAAIGCSI